jgi:hypothetical protein
LQNVQPLPGAASFAAEQRRQAVSVERLFTGTVRHFANISVDGRLTTPFFPGINPSPMEASDEKVHEAESGGEQQRAPLLKDQRAGISPVLFFLTERPWQRKSRHMPAFYLCGGAHGHGMPRGWSMLGQQQGGTAVQAGQYVLAFHDVFISI